MSAKNSRDHGIDRMDTDEDRTVQLKQIYAEWAQSYDHDNDHKLGTVSQPNAVMLLARHLKNPNAKILDVGCGTGLVGMHLIKAGFHNFDGTDLSQEMLEVAGSRGYRRLFQSDAEQGLPVENQTYDAVLCVGVFTHGHVGPEGLSQLIRVTKPGGVIVFTVNEGVWEKEHFDREVERLSAQGVWIELEKVKQHYMVNEKVDAWYVAAKLPA